jgi:hypothetical protein
MARTFMQTRSGRAGSLLILLAVLMLMGAGIVYLAQPAAAQEQQIPVNPCAPPGYPNGVPGTNGTVGGQTGDDFIVRLWECGRIIVKKAVSPVGAPVASFGFHTSFGDFSLAGGESFDTDKTLPMGVYSVAEMLPLGAGWSLASAFCDDGSSPAAIGLSEGETVTCTFNNRYEETTTTTEETTTTTTTVPPSTTTTTEAEGPELPYTGSSMWLPLLLGGLAVLLMGLGAWTFSWMKEADKT